MNGKIDPLSTALTATAGRPKTFLRLPKVKSRVGYSRASIYRKISEDKFPKPYDLGGGRAVAWLESDIDAWIQARIDQSASAGER